RDLYRVKTTEFLAKTLLPKIERADIHDAVVLPAPAYRTECATSTEGSRIRPAPEEGGPDTDERGALLDGHLEVVAHPHGQLVQHRGVHALGHETAANVAQCTEKRAH